eukprot:Clim_evm19s144 gene=Clim_evmTU19s144
MASISRIAHTMNLLVHGGYVVVLAPTVLPGGDPSSPGSFLMGSGQVNPGALFMMRVALLMHLALTLGSYMSLGRFEAMPFRRASTICNTLYMLSLLDFALSSGILEGLNGPALKVFFQKVGNDIHSVVNPLAAAPETRVFLAFTSHFVTASLLLTGLLTESEKEKLKRD